jgi:FtsZ-interacting cell division protein YlmF
MNSQTSNQTQANNVQTKTTWKRIKVPDRAYYFISQRARARKLPMWQYITQSIDFYETSMSDKVVADKTKAQNNSYYSVKLIMAVTEFIHKHDDKSYENVRKIALQVRDRKHVNVDTLLQLIDMYKARRKKSYVRAMVQELVRINVELMMQGQPQQTPQQTG